MTPPLSAIKSHNSMGAESKFYAALRTDQRSYLFLPVRDLARINAASRMKFGFRVMRVGCCLAGSLRVNKEKQSIKRRPRQLTSS